MKHKGRNGKRLKIAYEAKPAGNLRLR